MFGTFFCRLVYTLDVSGFFVITKLVYVVLKFLINYTLGLDGQLDSEILGDIRCLASAVREHMVSGFHCHHLNKVEHR
jgi:hypothetical protein